MRTTCTATSSPRPTALDHRLAEIAANQVEILHELKLQGGTLYQQAETLRQLTLQLKVLEIQIGLLRERLPKGDG